MSQVSQLPAPSNQKQQFNLADLIVHYLAHLGVEKVFGVPGGAIEPFLNSLARSARVNGPELVVARHECGSAFMAEGYYRESRKLGVVCATTGPGATNLITGICSAMAENIPLLVITAQTALHKFGKQALQESSCTAIDTVAMLRHCTRLSTLVSHPEQLEGKLISALRAAFQYPCAPVHLSIPSDILTSNIPTPKQIHTGLIKTRPPATDQQAIKTLSEILANANSVVVFIDEGSRAATAKIIQFCELINAPFIVGKMGKYWVDETHPLYRGVYGFAGHQSASDALDENVELIIAVGASFSELSSGGWNAKLLNERLVHIDENPEHFSRSIVAQHHVCGSPQIVFSLLLPYIQRLKANGKSWTTQALPSSTNSLGTNAILANEADCTSTASPIHPQRAITTLNRLIPEDSRIYLDAGNVWAWMAHYFVNHGQEGRVRAGIGFASMGWAVGASIGSALANSESLTICMVGDGAYLMSAQEITVAAQHNLPIVFIVLNDSAYGMVKHGQQMAGAESIGWQLNHVDFAIQARSIGIPGITVTNGSDLDKLDFEKLKSLNGPVLIDLKIDPEAVPPIGQRVKDLDNGPA